MIRIWLIIIALAVAGVLFIAWGWARWEHGPSGDYIFVLLVFLGLILIACALAVLYLRWLARPWL